MLLLCSTLCRLQKNNIEENQCASNHGSPRTWPSGRGTGANKCTPNPVLKMKTSCNYDIILCSEQMGNYMLLLILVKALPRSWPARAER